MTQLEAATNTPLRCPYCSELPTISPVIDYKTGIHIGHRAYCGECLISAPRGKTEQEAIQHWNQEIKWILQV